MDLPHQARDFALQRYESEDDLAHPADVSRLVAGAGADEEVQAAALLHDLVEDTDVTVSEIREAFGPRVGEIVAVLTEDESIQDYAERKGEHRERAREAGRDAALVFVADKLSNARRMRRGEKEPEPRKLEHYAATLATVRLAYPDLPLLDELDGELTALRTDAHA